MTREETIKIIDKTLKDFTECPGGEGYFLICRKDRCRKGGHSKILRKGAP